MTLFFEDYEGEITELTGQVCENLLCIQARREDGSLVPCVFRLKIREGLWHRFFIESNPTYMRWEELEELFEGDFDDEETFPVLNVGEKFKLNGKQIEKINMKQITKNSAEAGYLTILFEDRYFELICSDDEAVLRIAWGI